MFSSRKIALYSMGCRANQFDSEALFTDFAAQGFQRVPEFSGEADVHLINTCTVTNIGDQKSRSLIRKIIRENQKGKVIATGCSAQQDADRLLDLGVDLVVDNYHKKDLFTHFANNTQPEKITGNIFQLKEIHQPKVIRFGDKRRAHLKIQDGCNQYCTYCIIPFVRGRSRSLPAEKVMSQLNTYLQNGYREIILTGIHVGHYREGDSDFNGLLEKILGTPGEFRIRLSSIEPREITDKTLALFKAFPEKLCPFLHVAIQSGSTQVLKRMRRGYDGPWLQDLFEKIYRINPNFGIGLDVIAGFPGETEREHQETLDFIHRFPISYGHVFRFSPKKGTPAAKYTEQILEPVKKQRSADVRDLLKGKQRDFLLRQAGARQTVLWETPETGCTENFTHVRVPGYSGTPGETSPVELLPEYDTRSGEKFPHQWAVVK